MCYQIFVPVSETLINSHNLLLYLLSLSSLSFTSALTFFLRCYRCYMLQFLKVTLDVDSLLVGKNTDICALWVVFGVESSIYCSVEVVLKLHTLVFGYQAYLQIQDGCMSGSSMSGAENGKNGRMLQLFMILTLNLSCYVNFSEEQYYQFAGTNIFEPEICFG